VLPLRQRRLQGDRRGRRLGRRRRAGVLKARPRRVQVRAWRLRRLRFGPLPRLEHEEDALQRQAAFFAVDGDRQVSPFLGDGAPVIRCQLI